MRVTLRQLQAFAALARAGSFHRAAERMHITQPGLSVLIRQLEDAVGIKLIERTTRAMALTEAGREFLVSAERILGDVDRSVADLADLRVKRRGRVRVAAPPLLASTLVPPIVARFVALHPGVTVTVQDVLAEQVLRQIAVDEADIGIGTFRPSVVEVDRRRLFADELVLVCPREHRLAKRRKLGWKDLAGARVVAMSRDSSYQQLVDHALVEQSVPVERAFEVGYIGTALALVAAGLGVTVLPAYVADQLDRGRLVRIPLVDPIVTREVVVITRRGRELPPAVSAFLEALSELGDTPATPAPRAASSRAGRARG